MASVLSFPECYATYTNTELHTVLTTILCSTFLSLFGSSFVISSYLSEIKETGVRGTWSGYFNHSEGITSLVVLLALSDYLFSINSLTSYFLIIFDLKAYTRITCLLFRGWFQITAGSSFLWTVCIAIYLRSLFLNQIDLVRESSKYWLSFFIFSWGIPTGLTLILIGIQKVAQSSFGLCFPLPDYYLGLWFIPLQIPFLYILLTYIYLAYRIYQKRKANGTFSPDIEELSVDIRMEIRFILYILLYLLCWGLDFAGWLSYYFFQICIPYELLVYSSFMHYLQGFLNFIVYGFTHKNLRELLSTTVLLQLLMNFIIAPIAIWPKAIFFVIFKIKQKIKEKDVIEYNSVDEGSSLLGKSGPVINTNVLPSDIRGPIRPISENNPEFEDIDESNPSEF